MKTSAPFSLLQRNFDINLDTQYSKGDPVAVHSLKAHIFLLKLSTQGPVFTVTTEDYKPIHHYYIFTFYYRF